MRLRLESPHYLPFWLIGDPARNERDPVGGQYSDGQTNQESIQITRNQQVVGGAEWESQVTFDRGNGSVRFEAQVRKAFVDEWQLIDFLAQLAAEEEADELHGWSGDVWLRSSKHDGSFREWLLPDAAVSLMGTKREGAIGLMLTYRITAPGFSPDLSREGTEGVVLVAEGVVGNTCELVLYGTTSGGAWDSASSVFSGTAPASLTAGTILDIEIGDNSAGNVVTKTFQIVTPGGSASGGRIALETPVIDHWQTVVDAFAGIDTVNAIATTKGGRKLLFLGYTDAATGAATEVFARFTADNSVLGDSSIFYAAGSTAASFNAVSIDNVALRDADGFTIMADTD